MAWPSGIWVGSPGENACGHRSGGKPGKFDVTKAKEKSFRKEAVVKHRMSLRVEGDEDSDRLLDLMVPSCVAWLRAISPE